MNDSTKFQNLIDGRIVPAASGELMDSINPGTGDVWTHVPRTRSACGTCTRPSSSPMSSGSIRSRCSTLLVRTPIPSPVCTGRVTTGMSSCA
jgi:hypothetical protein